MATANGVHETTGSPSVNALPLGYGSLTVLAAERHASLPFRKRRDYDFAKGLHATPIAADEFSRAHLHFPIVFSKSDPVLPVALLGMEPGKNDFVSADGKWREGTYVPSFLRRYPFALARESKDSERMLLCADLTAPNFDPEAGPSEEKLFQDAKPTEFAQRILDFCQKYEEAMAKTRRTAEQIDKLGLFEDAQVTVERPGGGKVKIDGFRIVSEEKMRALDDATLADLARRGIIGLIAAHHYSIAQFSGITADVV